MLGSALDFPTAGDDGAKAVMVGGGLLLFAAGGVVLAAAAPAVVATVLLPPVAGLSLLTLLCVRGYHLRTLRSATRGAAVAPPFDDWADLVVAGLTATLVHLVYLFPALVFGAVALVGNVSGGLVARPGALLSALQTVAGFGVLFLLLYLVGALYVIPAAVANVAYEGRFGAAFRFRRIASGAFSEDYAVAWVLAGLLQVVVFPVALLLQSVAVGFFLQFLVAVAARYMYGRGFAAALDLDPVPAADSDASAPLDAVEGTSDGADGDGVAPAIRPAAGPPGDDRPSEDGDAGTSQAREARQPGDGASSTDDVDPLTEEVERGREE